MAGLQLIHLRIVSAQSSASANLIPAPPSTQPAGTIYKLYPTGILPSDLVSEIARVRNEVAFIQAEALSQWQALTPPVLTGQPPSG
jgi:hypothetical protein